MQIPQPQEDPEDTPQGVTLRDFDDFNTLRGQIFDGVRKSMMKSFPVNYGNVRIELGDVDYDEVEDIPISQQKKMLLENKYATKKLRGTLKLFDNTNDQLIEEKRISLMRVPYLTNRGTFIHGGNEYASIMQSRLLPGVFTRRQANGELETQFNVKPGTGVGFRVGFEPETTQYRVKISQANLHLYSLLRDIGTPDKDLEAAWGADIFKANQSKYDARVFDKAYERLVPARQKKLDKNKEDKVKSIRAALDNARIHSRVAQKNLPNMFNPKVASEWQARWEGKQAAEKAVDNMPFAPDFTPEEVLADYIDEDANVKSAADMQAMIRARQLSEKAKELYRQKSTIMAAQLHRNPAEFIVDQDGRMSGITHIPTGFRIHVPKELIPVGVRRAFSTWEGDDDDEGYVEPETVEPATEEVGEGDLSKVAAEDFIPDLSPQDMQEAYNSIYGHHGPRLASMDKWPEKWINKDVDSMGWLQWFDQYKAGRRSEDDDRQIKRWKSFKARHGTQFKKNPTPRRAYALRNWAIDPLKLIDDENTRGEVEKSMAKYKEEAWDKYNKSKDGQ